MATFHVDVLAHREKKGKFKEYEAGRMFLLKKKEEAKEEDE